MINKLGNLNLNCNLFSVYDFNSMTMTELLCKFFEKINEVIENMNTVSELTKWLVDEGLSKEVANQLEIWLNDGTIADLINKDLFNDLKDKIKELETNVKNEIDRIELGVKQDLLDRATNLENFKISLGEVDDTGRLTRALSTIQCGGILLIPKDITISNIEISGSNVTIVLLGSKITADSIVINGNNSGIYGINGKVYGKLKTVMVTQDVPKGGRDIHVGQHNFTTKDTIYSSYGIVGNDPGNNAHPVKILSVCNDVITIEEPTTDVIPKGAIIGNFAWDRLIKCTGVNTFVKNIDMRNIRGYALESEIGNSIFENIDISDNGLDIARVANARALFKNVNFGYVIDPAKQSISIYKDAYVEVDSCHFERDNFDVEFYIMDKSEGSCYIDVKNSTFDAKRTRNQPTIFFRNSWGVVNMDIREGAKIDTIKFDNCKFNSYSQGVIMIPYGNTYNVNVNNILIKNSEINSCPIGGGVSLTCDNFIIENTRICDTNKVFTNEVYLLGYSDKAPVKFKNCKFDTLNSMTIIEHNSRVENSEFYLCKNLFFGLKGFSVDNSFIRTNFGVYPNWDAESNSCITGSKILHYSMTTFANDLSQYFRILPYDYKVIDFKFINGTLGGYLFNIEDKVRYILNVKCSTNVGGLIGDDWLIPEGSTFEFLSLKDKNERYKICNLSSQTTLSADKSKGGLTFLIGGIYNFNVDNYVNILLDDGRVHTSVITEVDSARNAITIRNPIPGNASKGNGICSFTLL